MKKPLHYLLTFCLFAFSPSLFAQRYSTQVFPSITVTKDVIYGNNKSVLSGSSVSEDLKMDVYQPKDDTANKRPVVILLHTGGLIALPPNNFSPTGSKTDSAMVEMCSQFAKRGFVAIAMTYRLGWNPFSPTPAVRTKTLLNAVYRAVQDLRTGVRYLKRDVSISGNTFKVDTSRIVVGGMGAGSYISISAATLNKSDELTLEKFVDASSNPITPYVDQVISGDFYGMGGNSTNNTSNWPGYSSKIQMAFNMGGAIGDSSWMEPGEVPIVSFHCVLDPYTPYKFGAAIVPLANYHIADVSGSHDIIARANRLGNNNPFKNAGNTDVYTLRANKVNDGLDGLFPFVLPGVSPSTNNQSAPWEWWSETTQHSASGKSNNPDMSKAKALQYIDTVMGYLNPRMALVLNLSALSGLSENEPSTVSLKVFPNPSEGDFTIAVNEGSKDFINAVELSDIMGRVVKNSTGLRSNTILVESKNLIPGIYFVKVTIGAAVLCKRILVK